MSLKRALVFSIILGFLASFLLAGQKVYSADFTASYDITYAFSDSGQAKVTQKLVFTNNTDKFEVSEYNVSIGSTKVSNVSAFDNLGGVPVSTSVSDGTTKINAVIHDRVSGLGKTTNLTIIYYIDDLAIKRGSIWELSIPKVVTQQGVDVGDYNLHLQVPDSFGVLHSLVPNPASSQASPGTRTYNFDKSVVNTNIFASFGATQQFKFDLKYRLRNKNFLPAIGTIALPPDTDQQMILLTKLTPTPKRLYTDEDGNYLADFQVKGGTSLEVDVSGFVKISDQTETLQTTARPDPEKLKKYLVADKYWEVDNVQIQQKAKELKNARDIYNFVSSYLKYNFNRLEQATPDRFGAVSALQQPANSICTDYTDLFIAIARAAGIPARELEGFAYTDNSNTRPVKVGGLAAANILHAWPEYYDKDKQRWIAIDPTWGSTTHGINYFDKLDTNHFVFAVHGLSSTSPVPAGGYKITGSETDDLKVEFGTFPATNPVILEETADFGSSVGGLPSSGKVTLTNPSGTAIINPKITFDLPTAKLTSSSQVTEVSLLPYETKTYDIKLTAGSLLSTKKQAVKIKVEGSNLGTKFSQDLAQNVLVKPFFLTLNPISLLLLLTIALLIILFPPVFNRLKTVRIKKPKFLR